MMCRIVVFVAFAVLLACAQGAAADKACRGQSRCKEAETPARFLALLEESDWGMDWEAREPGSGAQEATILVTADIDLSVEPYPSTPLIVPLGLNLRVLGASPDAGIRLAFWPTAGTDLKPMIHFTGSLTFENLYVYNMFVYGYSADAGAFLTPRPIEHHPGGGSGGTTLLAFVKIRTLMTSDTFAGAERRGTGGELPVLPTPNQYFIEDVKGVAEQINLMKMFGGLDLSGDLDLSGAGEGQSAATDCLYSWACEAMGDIWFQDRLAIKAKNGSMSADIVTISGVSVTSVYSFQTIYRGITVEFEGVSASQPWPQLPPPSQQQQRCQTVSGTMRGQDYWGSRSSTASGMQCLPWRDISLPASGVNFSDTSVLDPGYLEGNSCRNPASHGGVWCFVDPQSDVNGTWPRWEYCDVPLCTAGTQDTCALAEDKGQSYRGDISVAKNGAPCIPWEESMAKALFGFLAVEGPTCRNVAGDMDRPFCFVDAFTWVYCDVPECTDDNLSVLPPAAPATASSLAVTVGVSIGAILLLVVLLSVAVVIWRRYHSRDSPKLLPKTQSMQGVRTSTHASTPSTGSIDAEGYLPSLGTMTSGSNSNGQISATSPIGILEQGNPVATGDVQLEKRLGSGFTSTVWSAQWLGTACAIKILNVANMPDILASRLIESVEANLMQTISHLHVVRIHQVYRVMQPVEEHVDKSGTALSSIWIVQELCDMGDMKTCHQLFGYSTEEKLLNTVSTLRQVALALQYLHMRGIVHGDLKRENVLMTSTRAPGSTSFTAKVADFGMAHCMSGRSSYYAQSAVFGDVIRMAPEAVSDAKISPAMDTYSFGVLIYEVVTNRSVAFTTAIKDVPIAERVKWSHANNGELLDSAFDNLKALAEWCWEHDPSERPGDEELLSDLKAMMPEVEMPQLGRNDEHTDKFDGNADDDDGYHVPMTTMIPSAVRVCASPF